MTKHQFIGLTGWYSVLFWIAILMPLEFLPVDYLAASVSQEWGQLAFGSFDLPDAISHAALFMPFGLLLSHIQDHYSVKRFKTGLILLIGLAALSELMQLLVELRTCSGIDLLMDYLGLGLGLAAGITWHRQPTLRAVVERFFSEKLILTGIAMLVMLYSYSFMPVYSGFANWQADFPLLMGNEEGGERAWNGDIYEVALFDRALHETEANSLSAGSITAESLQPLLHYDFSDANMQMQNDQLIGITEASHHFPESTLSVKPGEGSVAAIAGGGIRFAKGGSVSAAKLPDRVYQRIIDGNRLSLFVRFRAASKIDMGPARIVSLSNNVYERNFTLGQSMDTLMFRVRTPFAGENGSRPELIAKGCITPLQTQATVSIFTGAASHVHVNGSLCGARVYDRLSSAGPAYLVVPWHSVGAMALLFIGWSIFAVAYLAALRQRPEAGSKKLLMAAFLAAATVSLLSGIRYLMQ